MATVTFDTLEFVKTLEAAGVPSPQAEAISAAVRKAHDSADVTTKGDLRELELRLRGDITDVRGEQKLHRWMLGFVFAGVLSLVVKAFF